MFEKYGHIDQLAKVAPYLKGHEVVVHEKVDGTNVSLHFHDGMIDLWGRTQKIDLAAPGMYSPFVKWFLENEQTLHDAYSIYAPDNEALFTGELLNVNKLRYANASPFVLFDYRFISGPVVPKLVEREFDIHWLADGIYQWAHAFGCDVVPELYRGLFDNTPEPEKLIGPSAFDRKVTMEGFVLKAMHVDIPYRSEPIGEIALSHKTRLYAKYVRPEFREVKATSTKSEPTIALGEMYGTEARLQKAIQQATEQGLDYHKNRGILIKLALEDIEREEGEELNKKILDVFGKIVRKNIAANLMRTFNELS